MIASPTLRPISCRSSKAAYTAHGNLAICKRKSESIMISRPMALRPRFAPGLLFSRPHHVQLCALFVLLIRTPSLLNKTRCRLSPSAAWRSVCLQIHSFAPPAHTGFTFSRPLNAISNRCLHYIRKSAERNRKSCLTCLSKCAISDFLNTHKAIIHPGLK